MRSTNSVINHKYKYYIYIVVKNKDLLLDWNNNNPNQNPILLNLCDIQWLTNVQSRCKRYHQESENTIHRMGGNICKLYI